MAQRSTWLPLLLLATACGSRLDEGFEYGLTRQNGCGDVYLYASNVGDTNALFITGGGGVVQQARQAQTTTVTDFTLTANGVLQVRAQTGSSLTSRSCVDAFFGAPDVDRTYSAVSGRARITITPQQWPFALATLHLEDVVLAADDDPSDMIHIPVFEFTNTRVGWLPG